MVAVIVVVLAGSINGKLKFQSSLKHKKLNCCITDYQKEIQFQKLNAKKEDRELKVSCRI
jgi:hypothetical protein